MGDGWDTQRQHAGGATSRLLHGKEFKAVRRVTCGSSAYSPQLLHLTRAANGCGQLVIACGPHQRPALPRSPRLASPGPALSSPPRGPQPPRPVALHARLRPRAFAPLAPVALHPV